MRGPIDEDRVCDLMDAIQAAIKPARGAKPTLRDRVDATQATLGVLVALTMAAEGLPCTEEITGGLCEAVVRATRDWIAAYHGRN